MKILTLLLALSLVTCCALAQNAPITIIESGKLLVELVKVFKKGPSHKDIDMQEKQVSDICFKNSSNDQLYIELSKKMNDTTYKLLPRTLTLSLKSEECMLDLPPNIYHYKIFKKQNGVNFLSLEGEIRLKPNEKMERQVN